MTKVIFLGVGNGVTLDLYNTCFNIQNENGDYVTHEAFCLDSEENIFHAYEKNHSTVKSVSKIMNELNIKNLILYHTEESHSEDRKRLYTEEGKENFKGNIIVPDELEELKI